MKEIPLIIIGASYAFEIIDLVNNINNSSKKKIKIVGILDDNKKFYKKKILDIPVLGEIRDIVKFKKEKINISINNHKRRFVQKELIKKYNIKLNRLLTLIHPNSVIGSNVKIGFGSVVFQFVNIFSKAQIGYGVKIYPFASINPFVKIGSYCTIAVGSTLAVSSNLGEESFMGIYSHISENVIVAKGSMICEKSYVNKNFLKKNIKLIGSPAREIL